MGTPAPRTAKEKTMNKLLQALASFTSSASRTNRRGRRAPPTRGISRRWRPTFETLEGRTVLSAYTAATAADLIADINAANNQGGTNTITLTAPTTSPYVLTAVNNTTDYGNGLPKIAKKDNLTIIGNGDAIERSNGPTPFRLLDVALGASLTLENLTLENGNGWVHGGAILNRGELNLQGVTLQNNVALGGSGLQYANKASAAAATDGQGGGIWSDGTIVLQDLALPSGAVRHTILQNNNAAGGYGGTYYIKNNNGSLSLVAADGGQGLGGALYLAGGTTGAINATLTNVVLLNNGAYGGNGGSDVDPPGYPNNGGNGGAALGGAIDIAETGTVLMNGVTLENNTAEGGNGGDSWALGGTGGEAAGGAVCVTGGLSPVVSMDGLILQNNLAEGGSGGWTIGVNSNNFTGHGANAYGGAIYVGGGSANVMIGLTIIQGNEALAGADRLGIVSGLGGGLYIASAAPVSLDAWSVTNTTNNLDGSGLNGATANIDGVYAINTGF
jgi:hypothetical protein